MRKVRESAFKLIFESLFHDSGNTLRLLSEGLEAEDAAYLSAVVLGVKEKREELSALVGFYAKGFKTARIYKVDLSILLLACYELLYVADVPDKVSISEAVALARRYSTEKSPSYINGILASVYREKAAILGAESITDYIAAESTAAEPPVVDETEAEDK